MSVMVHVLLLVYLSLGACSVLVLSSIILFHDHNSSNLDQS